MKPVAAMDLLSDPFRERSICTLHRRIHVLGGAFEFESNSRELLRLVDAAYAYLPAHAFSAEPPHFRIRLLLTSDASPAADGEPPPVKMHSGGGLLCGTMDAANFVVVSPRERTGLVVVSRNMLGHPYHARYELLEFAVYLLASRAQQLVSLHAACVGRNGRGLLLIGATGGGKSTLALHCLLREMELVAEDSVLVEPNAMLATGIGSFLHLRTDSLRFLHETDETWVRKSPVIRRRSGMEKFEVDLRSARYRLALTPLEITSVVFLSTHGPANKGPADKSPANKGAAKHGDTPHPLLVPLARSELVTQLATSQPYAAAQPGWAAFDKHVSRLPAFELLRGEHPREATDALHHLIE